MDVMVRLPYEGTAWFELHTVLVGFGCTVSDVAYSAGYCEYEVRDVAGHLVTADYLLGNALCAAYEALLGEPWQS